MRGLGQRLGVEAMSLYNHVANKDDILGAMVDLVVEEIDQPLDADAWKASLRTGAISAHEVLLRHPWAAPLLLSGPSVSFTRLRQMNAILGNLREAGFSADMTDHAYHALDSHVMGFTLWAVGISAGLSRLGPVETFLETLPVAEYPYLAEHIEQHLKPRDPDAATEFEFGLDLILDGLERILRAP